MKKYKSKGYLEKKWKKSIELSNEIIKELNITNYVYIKDFKNVKNYIGSNYDIFIWDKEESDKVFNHLKSLGFYLPKIDFEYDKHMMIPPFFRENKQVYAPIHIYPYLGWYTLRFNMFNKEYDEIDYIFIDGHKNFPYHYEVALILFHGYIEDRLIPDYDIYHLNYIHDKLGYKMEDTLEILSSEFIEPFKYIYNKYINNKDKEVIIFKDYFMHIKICLRIKNNKLNNKLYFILIHTAKWLKIIRG